MKELKVFTAFSGYDSQMMALLQIPWLKIKLVGWSEIDEAAIASHNACFPEYKDCWKGNICDINWDEVEPFHLFTCSSPCQDFSMGGLRRGGEEGSGTRSSLLWECKRAIENKKPKFCLFENVKGLVDKTMFGTFCDWQQTMANLGYVNFWKVLNASDYGIPQNRERVIMVSILNECPDSLPEFDFPETFDLEQKPEDLLQNTLNSSLYFHPKKAEVVLDLLKNAKPGDEIATDFRGKLGPTDSSYRPKGKLVGRYVTPTCKGGVTPTLMASGQCTVSSMLSTGSHPCPGVIEIWDANKNGII